MGNTEDSKSMSKFGIVFFHIFLILLFIIGGIATYIFVSKKIDNSVTGINTSTINLHGENSNMVTFIGNEKNNDTFFIVFIICVSILIGLTLILLYLTEQRYNKNICFQNKSQQLSKNFEVTKSELEKKEANITTHEKKISKNNKTVLKEKDNYTYSKAIIDLYKAYSNSLPELN